MEDPNINDVDEKKRILESIKKRSLKDEIDVFMLGLSAPLEREIMRYIWSNNNMANLQMMDSYFCLRLGVCTHITLCRRLESLVKFGFLEKNDFRGMFFYSVKKDEDEKNE